MRKYATILVVLMLLITITSCSSESTTSTNDLINNEIISEEASPSERLIREDLQRSLFEYQDANGNYPITFHEYHIEKSLTDEKTYTAQISVTALSQYAEIRFSADVAYTLYDQGWSMDSCNWEMQDYEVVKYPTEDEVSFLPESNYAYGLKDWELNGNADQFSITGTQSIDWSPYVTGTEITTMTWNYDISLDQWYYFKTFHNQTDYVLTPEFEAAWPDLISNATETGFDITTENELIKMGSYHVELSDGQLSVEQDEIILTFTANSDIDFYIKEDECIQKGKLTVTATILKEAQTVDNKILGNFTYDAFIDCSIMNKGPYGYDFYPDVRHHKI